MADNSEQIQTNAVSPAEVTVDGTTVIQQTVADQILGDQYAAATKAAKNRRRGVRFSKMLPSGAISDEGAAGNPGNFGSF